MNRSIESEAIELSRDPLALIRRSFGDVYGPAFFVVLGCFLCQLGLGFGYAVNPLAGDIISEFDWDRANYSEAHSWQIWVVAFASPLIGGLAARFGAKRILDRVDRSTANLLWKCVTGRPSFYHHEDLTRVQERYRKTLWELTGNSNGARFRPF